MKSAPIHLFPRLPAKLKRRLQPYADAIEEIVAEKSWGLRKRRITPKDLLPITREIDRLVKRRIGFVPHTAITYYGIRLSWHYYRQAFELLGRKIAEQQQLENAIDRVIGNLARRFRFSFF